MGTTALDQLPTATVSTNGEGHLQDVAAGPDCFQDPANPQHSLILVPGSAKPLYELLFNHTLRPVEVAFDYAQEAKFSLSLLCMTPTAGHERFPATSAWNVPAPYGGILFPWKRGLVFLKPCRTREPRSGLPRIIPPKDRFWQPTPRLQPPPHWTREEWRALPFFIRAERARILLSSVTQNKR